MCVKFVGDFVRMRALGLGTEFGQIYPKWGVQIAEYFQTRSRESVCRILVIKINQLKAQAVFEPGLSYTDHFFSGSVI